MDTLVVSVDPGTVGAVAVVRYPHAADVASIRKAVVGVIEWGRRAGQTLETGSLAGACAAVSEIEKLIATTGVERVFVRCETVWVPRGGAKRPTSPKSFLGPAMALGCFLPLARPIGFYELMAPDEWRKLQGWTWPRGKSHREQAKAYAEQRALAFMGDWGMSDHAAEALCMGLVPPPMEVARGKR
jgi:hypothetical protein